MTAEVIVNGDTAYAFIPYAFRAIPRELPVRRWDPGRKCWLLPSRYVRRLVAALEAVGEVVEVRDPAGRPWSPPDPPPPVTGAARPGRWADELFAAVGPELGDRTFKALTRILHPDAGGDTRLMAELAAARDRARGTP